MKKAISFITATCVFTWVLTFSLYKTTAGASDNPGPEVSAHAAVLVEAKSGNVLYEKNPDEKMLIASTTKIMTALVTLEQSDPDDVLEIPLEATLVEGSSMYLKQGEQYTVKDLVYGLLLVSGNDAALALAEHVGGSTEGFASLMNEKAAQLGMSNSSFSNPHGLDADDHYSTARDLAILMRAAMENPVFKEITGTKSKNVKELTLVNHNKLLWRYPDTTGGKTGFTKAAGRTLVSSAQRDGMELIAVTLKDPDDWADHAALYDWGFDNFKYESILTEGEYARIPVISGVSGSVGVAPSGELNILVCKNWSPKLKAELPKFVFADVISGSHAGRLVALYNDMELGSIDLYYTETVKLQKGERLNAWERIQRSVFPAKQTPAIACNMFGPIAVREF